MRKLKFKRWCGDGWDGIDDFSHGCPTLYQYTGIKDKNGNEIYEGDILRYDNGDGSPELFPVGWSHEADQVGWNIYPYQQSEYEIVGNILENPELLGPK